jgi:hypothetical protein
MKTFFTMVTALGLVFAANAAAYSRPLSGSYHCACDSGQCPDGTQPVSIAIDEASGTIIINRVDAEVRGSYVITRYKDKARTTVQLAHLWIDFLEDGTIKYMEQRTCTLMP